MTRVVCFGTFDIIHPGHIFFLTAARNLGDELYVIISRDERRAQLSGATPVHTQKERMLVVGATKSVTQVIAGDKTDILKALRSLKPGIIALGHDQVYGVALLKDWVEKQNPQPKIVRLGQHKRARYSTSRIKEALCRKKKAL